MKYYAGLEGGSSYSNVVIIQENGQIVAKIDGGPSTNPLLIGEAECQTRIVTMIEKAKKAAGLGDNVILDSLGLCLSGCEIEESNKAFALSMITKYPNLAASISVQSDTIGSILTVCPEGGIVIIAGTGSNCLLLNPDGSKTTCGGWGYMLGDEGSGWWVAARAIQTIIHHEQNFQPSPFSIDVVKKIIFDYFKIQHSIEILKPTYVNFVKSHFAGVCTDLAKAAFEGDPLAQKLFYDAGFMLGSHIVALAPKIDSSLLQSEEGVKVVCVGSLFKSWQLLQKGFIEAMQKCAVNFTLLKLTQPSSLGAAYLASKDAGHDLLLNFKENSEIITKIMGKQNEGQTQMQNNQCVII